MSEDPATTPTRDAPGRARAHHEAVQRWLQALVPLALILAAVSAFRAPPGPGLEGRRLEVLVALGGLVLAGLAAMIIPRRLRAVHLGSVVALLVSAGALVWLEPTGAGFVALIVGVLLLARQVPERISLSAALISGVFVTVATVAPLDALALGAFYGMWFLTQRLDEANQQAERLLVELERARAAEVRAAGLAERQRLAREMHDVLAHSLSGLLLQIEGARMLAAENPTDPRLSTAIDRAHHLGRTGLEESRRAIATLRDDELPGPERLAGLAEHFEDDHGVPCRFTESGEPRELSSEARLAVFRVAQEALTNITKHAQPERVALCLRYEPSDTRLTVEDFTVKGARPRPSGDRGYGLTGMRERAELLGGTLTATATEDGFRVELSVPE